MADKKKKSHWDYKQPSSPTPKVPPPPKLSDPVVKNAGEPDLQETVSKLADAINSQELGDGQPADIEKALADVGWDQFKDVDVDPEAFDKHEQRYKDKAKFEQYKADFEMGLELDIPTWEATQLREAKEAQEAAEREAKEQEKRRVEDALFGNGEEREASNQGPADVRLPEPEGEYTPQGPADMRLPEPEGDIKPQGPPQEKETPQEPAGAGMEAVVGLLTEMAASLAAIQEVLASGEGGDFHG